jgi:hypothetical protein
MNGLQWYSPKRKPSFEPSLVPWFYLWFLNLKIMLKRNQWFFFPTDGAIFKGFFYGSLNFKSLFFMRVESTLYLWNVFSYRRLNLYLNMINNFTLHPLKILMKHFLKMITFFDVINLFLGGVYCLQFSLNVQVFEVVHQKTLKKIISSRTF